MTGEQPPNDFAGGSEDNVDDAIRLLDKSGRPYILITTGRIPNLRVASFLTGGSRQFFTDLMDQKVIQSIIHEP